MKNIYKPKIILLLIVLLLSFFKKRSNQEKSVHGYNFRDFFQSTLKTQKAIYLYDFKAKLLNLTLTLGSLRQSALALCAL